MLLLAALHSTILYVHPRARTQKKVTKRLEYLFPLLGSGCCCCCCGGGGGGDGSDGDVTMRDDGK